jgi:quinoprotein glucose dehydrogenase
VNWGGAAFDSVHQIVYANVTHAAHIIKLIPAADAASLKRPKGGDLGIQRGAPFAMTRTVAAGLSGALCNPPPWGELVAVDLKAGKVMWHTSVGTSEDRGPLGIALRTGTPLFSGVLVTASGLVFTGALDAYLRAFDARSGAELWQGRLPVPGAANPMTYEWKGEQYVLIAAGGHSEAGSTIGDSLVAFRLARRGEAPSLWSRTIDRPGGRFKAKLGAALAVAVLLIAAGWSWRRRSRRAAAGRNVAG